MSEALGQVRSLINFDNYGTKAKTENHGIVKIFEVSM